MENIDKIKEIVGEYNQSENTCIELIEQLKALGVSPSDSSSDSSLDYAVDAAQSICDISDKTENAELENTITSQSIHIDTLTSPVHIDDNDNHKDRCTKRSESAREKDYKKDSKGPDVHDLGQEPDSSKGTEVSGIPQCMAQSSEAAFDKKKLRLATEYALRYATLGSNVTEVTVPLLESEVLQEPMPLRYIDLTGNAGYATLPGSMNHIFQQAVIDCDYPLAAECALRISNSLYGHAENEDSSLDKIKTVEESVKYLSKARLYGNYLEAKELFLQDVCNFALKFLYATLKYTETETINKKKMVVANFLKEFPDFESLCNYCHFVSACLYYKTGISWLSDSDYVQSQEDFIQSRHHLYYADAYDTTLWLRKRVKEGIALSLARKSLINGKKKLDNYHQSNDDNEVWNSLFQIIDHFQGGLLTLDNLDDSTSGICLDIKKRTKIELYSGLRDVYNIGALFQSSRKRDPTSMWERAQDYGKKEQRLTEMLPEELRRAGLFELL